MTSSLTMRCGCVLLAVSLAAGCGRTGADPLAAARQFYDVHYDFYQLEDVEAVRDAVTPALYDLLKRMRREMDAGINVVEVDFWTFGQDGWIKGEPEYTVVHNDGRTAVVRLDYDFELNEIERKHSALTLERDVHTGRWLVSDLEGAEGYSFVAIFSRDAQGGPDECSVPEGDEPVPK